MFPTRASTSPKALPRRNSLLWAVVAVFYILAPLLHQFGEIAEVDLPAVTIVTHAYDSSSDIGGLTHSKECSTAYHCLSPAIIVSGFSEIDIPRQRQPFTTALLPDRLFLPFPAPPPKFAWDLG